MHLSTKISLFLVLAVITVGSVTYASENNARWQWSDRIFNNYSAENGLPYGGVSSVIEDKFGFIWLNTSDGLMRFDGQRFESVPLLFNKKNIDIRHMSIDAKSNIWLVGTQGLFRFNPFSRQLEQIERRSHEKITYLTTTNQDGKSAVWGATKQGLFKLNPDTLAQETFFAQQMNNYPNLRVFSIFLDAQSTVWLGTTHGLFMKKSNSEQFLPFDLSAYLQTSQRISAITQTADNTLWVATPRHGLLRIDTDHKVAKPILKGFKNEWIYSLQAILPNTLWLGTFGHGIIELNSQTNELTRITHDRLSSKSLANNDIWQVMKTQSDLVWVAHNQGASLYNPRQTMVKSAIGDTSRPQGIRDSKVNTIAVSQDKKIWLGLRSQGVDILSPQLGVVDQLIPDHTNPQHALPVGAVESISVSEQHGTYLGSNWGIYRLDDQKITRVATDKRSAEKYTGALLADATHLWAGGTDGLWRFTPNKNTLTNAIHITQKQQLSDDRIASLAKTPDGEILVGTWSGLNWVNLAGQITYKVENSEPVNSQLHSAFIADTLYDSQSRLWVATEGNGVFIGTATKHPKHFTQLTTKQGLSNNVVKAITSDSAGNIWLSTNSGIDVIDPKSLSISQLSTSYYHLFPPYFKGAAKRLETGELLFGGTGGLTIVEPNKIAAPSKLPPVTISKATFGNSLIYNPAIGTNTSNINFVPAKHNRFELEFTTLGIFDVANISYRYRLSGLSETWHEVDSDHRNITYTTLPPGDYQLELQNKNNTAGWNKVTTTINITVLPHWYQTLVAKIAAALLATLLIILTVNIYIASLKKRRDYLEQQVKIRTRDLEKTTEQLRQKTEELIQASVTDPLTGAYNRRFLERDIHNEVALAHRHYHQLDISQHTISEADIIFYLIDIDHFKKINDQYGHQVGDEVLVEFTRRLNRLARESDFVIRWGGEEFLLVVREASRERADKLAERICHEINQQPFTVEQKDIALSCSIGYAPFPFCSHNPTEVSWQSCIELADKALYVAKGVGRDCWIGVELKRSLSLPDTKININHIDSNALDFSSNTQLTMIQEKWDQTQQSE